MMLNSGMILADRKGCLAWKSEGRIEKVHLGMGKTTDVS